MKKFYIKVNATSIKLMPHLDFDIMPAIGLSTIMVRSTTKTVMNVDG